MIYSGSITDVPGVLIGHETNLEAMTGVTAVLFENGAIAGVDVRGGAPGTRETDAMSCGRLVEKIQAVMLAGGSAYGLDTASGAMRYLERQNRGVETAFGIVPVVGAAVIYDLGCGRSDVRPDADMGERACTNANKSCAQGSVGAGTGATLGKLVPGYDADKGGLGTASIRLPSGAMLGALAVVNAAGDVYDPHTGAFLAGTRDASGAPAPCIEKLLDMGTSSSFVGNTTLGVIATDAKLTREQANRIALLAHDGYARAIRPVHLPVDGDTIFAASTGEIEEDYIIICAAVAEVMARAIANAVTADGQNK